jgi:uncharacterized protein with PIN domain
MTFSYDTQNSSYYEQSVKLNCKIIDNLQTNSHFDNKEKSMYFVDDSTTHMRCFIDPVLEQKLKTDHLSLDYRCGIVKPPAKQYSDCLGYACNKDTHNQFAYNLDEFNTYHNYPVCKYRNNETEVTCCPENIQIFNNWTKRHAISEHPKVNSHLLMEDIPIVKHEGCRIEHP